MAKGSGMLAMGIMSFAALAIVGLLGFVVFKGGFEQTALPTTEEQKAGVAETAKLVSAGLRTGTAATVNTRIYDLQDAATSQVATNLTVEEWNGDGVGVGEVRLIEDGTITSATTDTATGTSIGKTLFMVGGAGTHRSQTRAGVAYYGIPKTVVVDEETENVRLDTHRAADDLSLACYDDSAVQGNTSGSPTDAPNFRGCGFVVGAAQVVSLDYLRIEVNNTDRAFNLKGIGFNMSSGSDIEDIRMSGTGAYEGFDSTPSLTWAKGTIPISLSQSPNNVKFYFELSEPLLVNEWDVVKTPPVVVDADADNPAEAGQIYIVDESWYRQTKGDRRLAKGVENDEDSPRNIGGPHLYIGFNIR